MKRGRGDTLTGGTNDVNPQIYTLTVREQNIDLSAVNAFPVPVYRFPLKRDRAMVMEILRVQWIIENVATVAAQNSLVALLSTSVPAGLTNLGASTEAEQFLAISGPTVVDAISLDGLFATAVGFAFTSRIIDHDKTDSAGHGILVATDQIYIALGSLGTGIPNAVCAKIIYRWKEVGLAEYIGIVQAQQNPA
jgi:hypothetical protein